MHIGNVEIIFEDIDNNNELVNKLGSENEVGKLKAIFVNTVELLWKMGYFVQQNNLNYYRLYFMYEPKEPYLGNYVTELGRYYQPDRAAIEFNIPRLLAQVDYNLNKISKFFVYVCHHELIHAHHDKLKQDLVSRKTHLYKDLVKDAKDIERGFMHILDVLHSEGCAYYFSDGLTSEDITSASKSIKFTILKKEIDSRISETKGIINTIPKDSYFTRFKKKFSFYTDREIKTNRNYIDSLKKACAKLQELNRDFLGTYNTFLTLTGSLDNVIYPLGGYMCRTIMAAFPNMGSKIFKIDYLEFIAYYEVAERKLKGTPIVTKKMVRKIIKSLSYLKSLLKKNYRFAEA